MFAFRPVVAVLAALACSAVVIEAACPAICSTATVYGQLPGGRGECPCNSAMTSAGRTGPNDCTCGVCYGVQNGHVVGYGKPCPSWASTDCSSCDVSASSSNTDTSTSTNANGASAIAKTKPATVKPSTSTSTNAPSSTAQGEPKLTTSPTVATGTGNTTSSTAGSSHNDTSAGSKKSENAKKEDDSAGGMATWQIGLIVCSVVLAFAVGVSMLMSSYHKKHGDNDEDELVVPKDQAPSNEDYWEPTTTRQQHGSSAPMPPMQVVPEPVPMAQPVLAQQVPVQQMQAMPMQQQPMMQMQQVQQMQVQQVQQMQVMRSNQRPISAEL